MRMLTDNTQVREGIDLPILFDILRTAQASVTPPSLYEFFRAMIIHEVFTAQSLATCSAFWRSWSRCLRNVARSFFSR
jgi:hypothetical protein